MISINFCHFSRKFRIFDCRKASRHKRTLFSRQEWTVRCAVRKRLILLAKIYGVRSDNKNGRFQTMKKGENIFKRKDGRWEARYIKGYELSGKIKYGFCYGKTYKEAKEKVTKYKAALLVGKPTPQTGKRHRFAFYCNEWLRLRKSKIPHQHHQHGYSLFCVRQQRGGLPWKLPRTALCAGGRH